MFLPYLLAFCRIVIGLVFLVSSVSKAWDMPAFERAVANFSILPKRLNRIAAFLFLGGEFAVIAFVTVGDQFLGLGFLLAAFLLLTFCVALASVLMRKIQTACNCFGPSEKPVSPYDLWRNTGFIVCALVGWGSISISGGASARLEPVAVGLVGLAAAVFVMAWTQIAEIAQLLQQS